ncbi:MAG: hypothetical protein Q7U04_00670 [Bacteriovorax sp.]|nr:hypothetical protein [Bacteriovorax sp.]
MVHILAKTNLNLNEIEGFILSPGDIYWQQKSGAEVLISAKADFLNIELIEKLSKARHVLLIENQINMKIQNEFIENFQGHKSKLLIKEKLPWRSRLISLMSVDFVNEEVSQFEVDILVWKVFSTVTSEQSQKLLERDIGLFKRSMSVCSSYTLCAFLLGYYSDEFLSQLYTNTFLNLMDFQTTTPMPVVKEQLEKIRNQATLNDEYKKELIEIYKLEKMNQSFIGERYDGSGAWSINKYEMSDLELVLVALHNHYSYKDSSPQSIFHQIQKSFFKCDEKVLRLLQKCLKEKELEFVA